jgi:hypothetical protein
VKSPRLIRWAHLPDGRIAALWCDVLGEMRRTVVDGITLEHLDGPALAPDVLFMLRGDMRDVPHYYYDGVLEPATEALCS